MKVLTIHQPYAWAICNGHKQVENRTWDTPHRGLLLIHASSSRDSLRAFAEDPTLEDDTPLPPLDSLPLGAIVGAVHLSDIVSVSTARRRGMKRLSGPRCWILSSPMAFSDPVYCKGSQRLWDLPDHLQSIIQNLLPNEGLPILIEPSNTKVVNVRTAKPGTYIYVGCAVRGRFAASIWGNPFRVGPDGDITQVLALYRNHILSSPDLVSKLPELRGKAMDCWCCDGNVTTPSPMVSRPSLS